VLVSYLSGSRPSAARLTTEQYEAVLAGVFLALNLDPQP
jgi:hypothetical protein